MQFNLVGLGTPRDDRQARVASTWLGDLADALRSHGQPVDCWCVASERSEDVRSVTSALYRHVLRQVRAHGEVAVVGHGLEVTPVLLALDQLLRAADVRAQVLLTWVAPESPVHPGAALSLDWERLKRACSIIAPNPRVQRELASRRVSSLVIEDGSQSALRLASSSLKWRRGGGSREQGCTAL